MKLYQLVAAMVLRVGQKDGSIRPLSWAELGDIFGVTKDVVRHRITRFKQKYNVVDADVTRTWNREFLNTHTPEEEKQELTGLQLLPGDLLKYENHNEVVIGIDNDTVTVGAEDEIVKSTVQTGEDVQSPVSETVEVKNEITAPIVVAKVQIEPLQFLLTPAVLVVIRDGQPLSIDKSHKNFSRIEASLKSGDWQDVLDYIDMKNTLTKFSNGRVTVEEGKVTLDGEMVSGKLANRLITCLLEENLEGLESISKFLEKCDENPDFRVVTRIYDFIAHNDLRLDKDGDVLAYKIVKNNYFDKYTGTMDNSPGLVVKMKRNKVNPKDEETCSHGLHVAAKSYLPSYGSVGYGDKVLLCKVNPKDFVSIPTDYNSMKARVCEYLVLKDVTENFKTVDEGIQA